MSNLLESIAHFASDAKKGVAYTDSLSGKSSLSKITKSARVEPICIVSRDVMNLDYTPKIIDNTLNIFVGYYLQAISLMTQIGGARVAKVLDTLNPDRSFSSLLTTLESQEDKMIADSLHHFATESYEYRLPSTHNKLALEDRAKSRYLKIKNTVKDDLTPLHDLKDKKNKDDIKGSGKSGSLKEVYASGDLMVGKIVDITMKINEQSHTLPVGFNLTGVPLPEHTVTSMLTSTANDRKTKELWRGWRSGRLGFWKDIVFASELIKEHKKTLMEDTTGVYGEIVNRARKNSAIGVASGDPSLATSSNIFIISSDVAEDIEYRLGGKLSDYKVRQKLFDSTYGILLVVIDKQFERVIVYHNGIKMASNISVKDIKETKKKGNDGEFVDIMKNLMSGQAPRGGGFM